jgi:nicotinic acid mononucleotide adenylyltransferase
MFDMEFKFNFLKKSIEDNFPTANITIRRTEEESFSKYWHITNLCSLDYKLIIGDDCLENITKWQDFKLMQEHGLQLVVVQRELSYKEISNYKSSLPIYEIISHDRESIENAHNMSSTHIRSQVEDLLVNMCKYKLD